MKYGGDCSEIGCVQQAKEAGYDNLDGWIMNTKNIGNKLETGQVHGIAKKACNICKTKMDSEGIKESKDRDKD